MYSVLCYINKHERIVSFLIMGLTVVIGLICGLLTLPCGVDSWSDEGYFFLLVQNAINNGQVEGITQTPNIIAKLLGNDICSSILSLRTGGIFY